MSANCSGSVGRASRSWCPPTRDWETHEPWIVKLDDDSIWLRETGAPAEGYLARTHLVVLRDDGVWFYLMAAEATGNPKAPGRLAELEKRRQERADSAELLIVHLPGLGLQHRTGGTTR